MTRVHPTAGVARRAKKLGEQIQAAFPNEPVHLIGHSMGGLDARALVADPIWQPRVLSLTTIATPHLGSGLADFAKLRDGRIYSVLERLGVDHAGFLDVTLGAAHEFNRRTPRPSGCQPSAWPGSPTTRTSAGHCVGFTRRSGRWKGPNDGLVSAVSATAFGEPVPSWPVDHLRQMNWFPADAPTVPFPPVVRHYAEIVANLASLPWELDRLAEMAPRETA